MKNDARDRLDRYDYRLLGGAMLIYSIVTLGNIGRWSIWFDEAFSAFLLRFNFADILRLTGLDVHPPLYYWTLKVWTWFWGSSDIAMRLLSVVCILVAMLGMYKLVKYMFQDSKVAAAAVYVMALTPMLVRFGDEARMYAMVTAIAVWATYVLAKVMRRPSKKLWSYYTILIVAGMLTHYFVAFVWLSHWVWRAIAIKSEGKQFWKNYFSKQWVLTHIGAFLLLAPWLPVMARQLTSAQSGFWIPSVTAYTPVDYLSNTLLYMEYGEAKNRAALLLFVALIAIGYIVSHGSKLVTSVNRTGYRLLATVAFVPPLLLVLLSMPPLRSSFIDRYLLTSISFSAAFVGVNIALMWQDKKTRRNTLVATAILVLTFGYGIFNVYYYGNYNKNSATSIRTRDLVQKMDQIGQPGQPLLANSAWVYYEAAAYDSPNHPVYYLSSSLNRGFGSLQPLRQSSFGKITNLDNFAKNHKYIWYFGNVGDNQITPPDSNWKPIKQIAIHSSIDGRSPYKATLYDTAP